MKLKQLMMPLPYRRLVIAFVAGFCVMVFELVAARVMSPVVGASTYVWASIIGVIIAAMSLGYWLGGVLADTRSRDGDVAWLLLGAALLMLTMLCQYHDILRWVAQLPIDVRLQATVAASLLFAPTSLVLGAVSPYLVERQTDTLARTGRSVASLSAVNSIGGIVGTFAAGFFLFDWLGIHDVLVVLISLLVLASWLMVPGQRWQWRVVVSVLCVGLALGYRVAPVVRAQAAQTIDTAAAHYTLQQWRQQDGAIIRGIASGPAGVQSGVSVLRPNDLVFWYTQQMARAVERVPHKQRILVLGGGTFTLPRYLAQRYPDSRIDVVEIDPGLLPVAQQYFFYNNPRNVRPIFQDARVFLERTTERYDVVLVDVYNDGDVPASLVTEEYAAALRRHLQPHTQVVVNMIASRQPACLPLFATQDAPYTRLLGPGRFYYRQPDGSYSNIVAIYGHEQPQTGQSAPFARQAPYRDNYAPLERLRQQCELAVGR
ncbi:MAG: fused MFS/spermidine synthase [Candidatus Saccharibacteria bacterium]|nr:fused MFS/spermidine synthase [Candidatus Saccharibacteria bacterium]